MTLASRSKQRIATIGVVVLSVILVGAVGFGGYRYYQSRQASKGLTLTNNPADSLSQVAVNWSKQSGFKQVYFYDGAANGLDNTSPFVTRIYEGNKSLFAAKDSIISALQEGSYTAKADQHQPDPNGYGITTDAAGFTGYSKNNNQPYWMVQGINAAGDDVRVEITDKSYYDTSNGEHFGEHAVSGGKTAVVFSFHSHQRLK